MALTSVSMISVVLNILLIAAVIALLIDLHRKQRKIKEVVAELGSDSLEHYLTEIRRRGFDFTLKPKKNK